MQGNNSSGLLYKNTDFTLSRSKTEKKETKSDLKLDRLPESEKVKCQVVSNIIFALLDLF